MAAATALEKITIPEGSLLYRVADKVCVYTLSNIKCTTRKCGDTGKRGVYFANYLLMALAMATEYSRDMQLGVFITTRTITVYKGKYTYRNIKPNKPILPPNPLLPPSNSSDKSLSPDRHIGHFNDEMLPLLYNNTGTERNVDDTPDEGELFITSPRDLANIKLLSTYKLNTEQLKAVISGQSNEDINRYDINFYLREGVLTRFYCNKSKSYKRRRRNLGQSA